MAENAMSDHNPKLTLLACPFCGGAGVWDAETDTNGEGSYCVRCQSCACQGPWWRTLGNALSAWNRRVA